LNATTSIRVAEKNRNYLTKTFEIFGWSPLPLCSGCERCSSFYPMPPHVLVDFVVLPPGHGSSVTDFWGWDAHETQLRSPDDASGDIGGWSARRALKPKFYLPTQTLVTAGILPFRKNSHGIVENRNRDLMIISHRDWPLDHEAGLL
jgi:hypothetical protein